MFVSLYYTFFKDICDLFFHKKDDRLDNGLTLRIIFVIYSLYKNQMSLSTGTTDKPNAPEILDKTYHTVTERLSVYSLEMIYCNRI